MSDTLAMYDVICMRSLMFIKRCLSGESDVVRFIAQYGVLYGGMVSWIGRNVLTYSRHYQLPASYLLSDHCTASKLEEICKSRVPVEFYNKVLCLLELMMMKKNVTNETSRWVWFLLHAECLPGMAKIQSQEHFINDNSNKQYQV